jgi:hypothetical protein
MVAASGLFHQVMDGLTKAEGVPLVTIPPRGHPMRGLLLAHDSRYAVALLLKFYNEPRALALQLPSKQQN